MFGRDLVRPSRTRDAAFDNARDPATAAYTFACVACGAPLAVPFTVLLDAGLRYESELGADVAAQAREHFGIGVVGKAQDGGWPAMARAECAGCGVPYLVYAGVREPANGHFVVTIQGVTELTSGARAA